MKNILCCRGAYENNENCLFVYLLSASFWFFFCIYVSFIFEIGIFILVIMKTISDKFNYKYAFIWWNIVLYFPKEDLK